MTREDLRRAGVRLLNRGGAANADVLLVRTPRGAVIVKDYAQRNVGVRALLAPLLVRHEITMLRRARGLLGVPAWCERVDRLALAMEYLEGRPVRRRWHAGRLPPAFFDALEGILEGLARRGLAHLDLRSPTNVLVSPEGAPAVIDFGSATALPLPRSVRVWLERRALRKLRRRTEGDGSLSVPTLEGVIPDAGPLDLVARGVRWRRYEAGDLSDPAPLVLLSDLGLGAGVYAELLASAEGTGRRVIAFDLPGSGESGRGRGRRDPARFGRELEILLRALRLERIDLGGLGLGGIVARAFAARRPVRVRALVTVDAPVWRVDPSLALRLEAARGDPARLRELVSAAGPKGMTARALAVTAHVLDGVPTDELARPLRALPVRRGGSGVLELDPRRLPVPAVPWAALFTDPGHPGLEEAEPLSGVRASLADGCLSRPEVLWESLAKLLAART